jgi:hypothetical protein
MQHCTRDQQCQGFRLELIYQPQDMLRRAANAIREARSNDCIVLAKAALQAGLRSKDDIGELLAGRRVCARKVNGAAERAVARPIWKRSTA